MAPRQDPADLKHFSEPILVDSQAGSDYSNTPYGYGGATHSTSTSYIDPIRPNIALRPTVGYRSRFRASVGGIRIGPEDPQRQSARTRAAQLELPRHRTSV